MSHQAIGLLETRGLVALVEGTDAMLKAAKEVLSEEFARTPSPKDDTERF